MFSDGSSSDGITGHGTSFTIEFVFAAFPAFVTFILMKDGNTIPATSHAELDSLTTAVYLEIADAQYSDAGTYTLEVSNSIGSSSREFTLMIIGKVSHSQKWEYVDVTSVSLSLAAPPGIVSSPMNHVIIANSSLSVSCTTNVTSTISWRVGNTELMDGGRFSISSESESSFFTISSVVEEDSGLYSCTAAIGSGTPSSASFEITVLPFRESLYIAVHKL